MRYVNLKLSARLCVFASGSLITVICNEFTLIKVSCLYLGQYNGKFFNTVSLRILLRVLFLQIGHKIHYSSIKSPPNIIR